MCKCTCKAKGMIGHVTADHHLHHHGHDGHHDGEEDSEDKSQSTVGSRTRGRHGGSHEVVIDIPECEYEYI